MHIKGNLLNPKLIIIFFFFNSSNSQPGCHTARFSVLFCQPPNEYGCYLCCFFAAKGQIPLNWQNLQQLGLIPVSCWELLSPTDLQWVWQLTQGEPLMPMETVRKSWHEAGHGEGFSSFLQALISIPKWKWEKQTYRHSFFSLVVYQLS